MNKRESLVKIVLYEPIYEERLKILLEENALFSGSIENILNNQRKEFNTLIFLDKNEIAQGFIQGKGAEIVFIGISNFFRNKGYGRLLYNKYFKLFSVEKAGFYCRVEDANARLFWQKMGFKTYYSITDSIANYSITFNRLNKNIFNEKCDTTIEIYIKDKDNNPIGEIFKCNAFKEKEYYLLESEFSHFNEDYDRTIHISIDDKILSKAKLKYSGKYGLEYNGSGAFSKLNKIPISVIE